jgi:hypothetical protein
MDENDAGRLLPTGYFRSGRKMRADFAQPVTG